MSMAGMEVKPDNGRNQPYQAWGTFDSEVIYCTSLKSRGLRMSANCMLVPCFRIDPVNTFVAARWPGMIFHSLCGEG